MICGLECDSWILGEIFNIGCNKLINICVYVDKFFGFIMKIFYWFLNEFYYNNIEFMEVESVVILFGDWVFRV